MLRQHFIVVLILSLLFVLPSAWATDPEDCRVKVFGEDTLALRGELEKAGLDVAGRNGAEGFVEVIVSPSELKRLAEKGYKTEIIERFGDRKTRAVPSEYHDYNEMLAVLNATVSSYPDLVKLIDVGSYYDVGPTHGGRNIYALKISDHVAQDEDEPNILLTMDRHAREVTTLEFGLWTIEKLTTQYSFDPDVKKWVDNNQIYIICCMNPDGKQYCHDVDEWWRKNRMPYAGEFGVDVNRNYDFNWDGPYGGSAYPSS
ncbi:MAG: M14 family zinc carboxypeptidase, partial [Planctomycetota bacterium]